MSLVPYVTQLAPQANTQSSQSQLKVVIVYTDKISECQLKLLKECHDLLSQNLGVLIKQANELDSLMPKMKFFIIPAHKDDLIKKIRLRFEKPIIYLPRAIIEARRHHNVNLPIRNLAISLTMHHCRIFLVKSCDIPNIRNKINEMCGTIVTSFNDKDLNVVITDRADNRYCSKAFKRNIPVVSRNWVDENHSKALEESNFGLDALESITEHHIKPFYGLSFKIGIENSNLKELIIENQGCIVYTNEDNVTQIISVDDEEFLRACVASGYHLSKREYKENMPPPPPPPPVGGSLSDMIHKALTTPQTVEMASTQMRRLPDPELLIERSVEPSQQLYWNDK